MADPREVNIEKGTVVVQEKQPTAWLHILDNTEGIETNELWEVLSFSKDHPFGTPGIDYSDSFTVTSIPLYKE